MQKLWNLAFFKGVHYMSLICRLKVRKIKSCCHVFLQKHMDTYSADCFDSIALFLCIHIIHRYKVLMHKRNAPALDK